MRIINKIIGIIDNKTFQIYEKVYLSTIFIVEQRRYIEKTFMKMIFQMSGQNILA